MGTRLTARYVRRRTAEIHVYNAISAGFGMTKRGHPVDGWTVVYMNGSWRAS